MFEEIDSSGFADGCGNGLGDGAGWGGNHYGSPRSNGERK